MISKRTPWERVFCLQKKWCNLQIKYLCEKIKAVLRCWRKHRILSLRENTFKILGPSGRPSEYQKWHNGEWLALLFKNEILGSIQDITKERETHVNNLRSANDVVIEGAEKAKFWAKLFISVFHP